MMHILQEKAERIYKSLIAESQIAGDKAVIIYDLSVLDHRLSLLSENFPVNTHHAIAVKTNSNPLVLRHIAEKGFGLEAASLEEVKLAVTAGVHTSKIVFDSPCKTRAEIQYCHENIPGLLVNANSLEELDRYPKDFNGILGLRVNPLVKIDAPEIFDVSSKRSKFGVPITKRNEIIQAALTYTNITVLHMHIGSGLMNFSNNVIAAKRIVEIADEINAERIKAGIGSRISTIDIGGGINFDINDSSSFSVCSFVKELQTIPGLFTTYKVVTEYGHFVHKHCAFMVSNVEYVIPGATKEHPSTIFIHVGADLFLRKVYSNLLIEYPYSVLFQDGNKKENEKLYNVAGPLCFAGDFLYENISLSIVSEGDKFFMYNVGANTNSLWSRHCSRVEPEFIVV